MRLLILVFIASCIVNLSYGAGPNVSKPYHDLETHTKEKRVVRKTKGEKLLNSRKKVIPKLQMTVHGISGEEGSEARL